MRAVIVEVKGGKGSGHFGHSGRPGKVGGSSPGTGGASATPRNSTEQGLSEIVTAYAAMHKRGAMTYPGFVVKHGQFFDPPKKGEALPSWCDEGEMKECYYNSIMSVMGAPDDVYYTEGYAFVEGIEGFPFEHGWLTTADGNVIDPTWEPGHGTAYYGIRMTNNFVSEQTLKTGMAGVLPNDWMNSHELGRNGFPEGALYEE